MHKTLIAALLGPLPCLGIIYLASESPARADVPSFTGIGSNAVPSGKVSIPEGTAVHLALLKDLKSGGSKGGEDVPFEVSQDVYGPGHVLLIAANTPAYGKIQESSRRGIFGKAGKLKFTIDYILAPDKTHIPLRSDP